MKKNIVGKSLKIKVHIIWAESHFGQNDTLARDTLARVTFWPETLWPVSLASFGVLKGEKKIHREQILKRIMLFDCINFTGTRLEEVS